jgi:hypothetical protein
VAVPAVYDDIEVKVAGGAVGVCMLAAVDKRLALFSKAEFGRI